MLVFLQDPASKVPLAWIATLSSLILALSGLIFIYCTNFHVFRAPDMPKGSGWTYQGIVGSTSPKVLTDSAKKSLKTQTIEKVLAGCVHDWGSVFDDNWRQRMQFTFLLIYFFLYLSAIVAFGSIGQLLVVSKSKEPAGEHAGGEQHMAPDNPTH
jgi:hypothetical protein